MNAMEADPNPTDQFSHVAPHDPECQRILDALAHLRAGRTSPWVSVGDLHRYLNLPTCRLEPHLRHLAALECIDVEHHNMTAKTSRYATLRHLGRSIRETLSPREGQ